MVAYTHDLAAVLADVLTLGLALGHLRADCDRLTPYAVISRYPGVGPEPTETEGRDAVAAAHRIRDAIRPLLAPAKP